MSDWIRDSKTDLIKINSDKINDIVRRLMDKIKTLTQEKDHAVKEYNLLREEYNKLLHMIDRGYANDQMKGMEYDDLETDGSFASLPDMRDLSKKDAQSADSRDKTKDQPFLHSTDHSACCSKELSMKLVEQNEILQKTIRDILKLRGCSIDDYLKFTYSREKLMAKEREINDLKMKIKKLKEKETTDPKLPASDSGVDSIKKLSDSESVTDLSKQLAGVTLQRSKEASPEVWGAVESGHSDSKGLDSSSCTTCKRKFTNGTQLKDHERKCRSMLN